ncbi:hypothetical protein BAE46_00785 [Glaciecola punicea]|nr:hypothetical protein BAE46_00785 [Glaciecola punicea]
MRAFGKNSKESHLYQSFYKKVLGNENVLIDKNNNTEPTKLIRSLTGYTKTKTSKFDMVQNYQISHVFGRTKNVFAFTAPWNLVYLPKLLDPFTGHEAKGSMVDEFTQLFQKQIFNKFESMIADFNQLMSNDEFNDNITEYFERLANAETINIDEFGKLKKSVTEGFSQIVL